MHIADYQVAEAPRDCPAIAIPVDQTNDKLKAQIVEKDGQIAVLMQRVAELSSPPEPNAPNVLVQNATVAPGQRIAHIPVVLSEAPRQTMALRWSTANGIGTWSGEHYKSTSGWLIFNPGEQRHTIKVELLRDLTAAQTVQVVITDRPINPPVKVEQSTGLISVGKAFTPPSDRHPLPAKPTGLKLAWRQDFADPAFCVSSEGRAPQGRSCWQSRLTHGYTQDANKETGYYAPPDLFPNVTMTGLDASGKRFIQAERHPEGFSRGDRQSILRSWDRQPFTYSAGILQSSKIPVVIGTGSYVEARLKLDVVQGTWPAFWLMPNDGSWPPEIDILEGWFNAKNLSSSDSLATTVHWRNKGGKHLAYGTTVPLSALIPGFDLRQWHTYGVHIEQDWLTYYIDDVPTVRSPNPTRRGTHWYIILNVGVGGLAGDPPPGAPFPARMGLDWVSVWN